MMNIIVGKRSRARGYPATAMLLAVIPLLLLGASEVRIRPTGTFSDMKSVSDGPKGIRGMEVRIVYPGVDSNYDAVVQIAEGTPDLLVVVPVAPSFLDPSQDASIVRFENPKESERAFSFRGRVTKVGLEGEFTLGKEGISRKVILPRGKSYWDSGGVSGSGLKHTGTFSDMRFIEDAGDVLGTEVRIVKTAEGYQGMVQFAEGHPDPLSLAVVSFGNEDAVSMRFQDSDKAHRKSYFPTSFEGHITKTGLEGVFRFGGDVSKYEAVNWDWEVKLPRRKSYWD